MRRVASGLVFVAALLILGAAPPAKVPVVKVIGLWAYAGQGGISLPGGKSQGISLTIKEWEGDTFSGYLDYDLGWKAQSLPITGSIGRVKRTITFTESDKGIVHPFSPVLGRGKFEGRFSEVVIHGTALVYLKGDATRPVKCSFSIALLRPLEPGDAGPAR